MASAPDKRADGHGTTGPGVVTFGFDVLDRVEQAVAMVKERMRRSVSALERDRKEEFDDWIKGVDAVIAAVGD